MAASPDTPDAPDAPDAPGTFGAAEGPGARGAVQAQAAGPTPATAHRISGLRRVLGAGTAPSGQRWPLHERAAAQLAETSALAQAAPFSLMARAGLSVARLARALAPHAQRVLVLAGPGHNGGDGLVAARCLQAAGWQVQVALTTRPDQLPPDAARAWREAQAAGVPCTVLGDQDTPSADPGEASALPWPRPDLLIDAVLGLGARRAPAGPVAKAIDLGRSLAAQAVPVLAVDLPSGLHPDTGQPLGAADQVLPATATLCLLSLRPGCFTGLGRDVAGQVWLDDLGCEQAQAGATAWLGGWGRFAPRPHAAHKGTQGDVAVVGGAAGTAGAAWLAGSAALAAGAGRVYLSLLDSSGATLNPQRLELMVRAHGWALVPHRLRTLTVVAGCGGGPDIATALPALLAHAGRLLLDADALNTVAADTALQAQLQHRTARGAPTLLTPHPLEAARLLGQSTTTVQADRLAAARELAQRYGAVVVLKGSGSVVASPRGSTSINPTGNASLASAGTGDVLAGWLGGLWAQAACPSTDLHALVEGGVWRHGAAADRHRAAGFPGPLLATCLIDELLGAWPVSGAELVDPTTRPP